MPEPAPDNRFPPRWRVILAFAIVPGVAALLMAGVNPGYDGLQDSFERVWRPAILFALFGAYPIALIVGIPAYLFLRERFKGTWLNCAIAGAAIAGLPWLFLTMILPSPDQASIGGKATVVDGSMTAYGWQLQLQFTGTIAIYGIAAGILFWAIATVGTKTR
ncbi:MAG: hypothetical protein ABWZ75_09475 [Novosphingobium sp.]